MLTRRGLIGGALAGLTSLFFPRKLLAMWHKNIPKCIKISDQVIRVLKYNGSFTTDKVEFVLNNGEIITGTCWNKAQPFEEIVQAITEQIRRGANANLKWTWVIIVDNNSLCFATLTAPSFTTSCRKRNHQNKP